MEGRTGSNVKHKRGVYGGKEINSFLGAVTPSKTIQFNSNFSDVIPSPPL